MSQYLLTPLYINAEFLIYAPTITFFFFSDKLMCVCLLLVNVGTAALLSPFARKMVYCLKKCVQERWKMVLIATLNKNVPKHKTNVSHRVST